MIDFIISYITPGYGPGFSNIGMWVILGITMLVSMAVSGTLRSRFNEYSQIPTRMTGAQIAEAMLHQNGINDVRVVSVPGHLTDFYDPVGKTVNLSEPVYSQANVAAAAVAAHECGHAVQHQQAYHWLGLRTRMVPAVQFASTALNWVLILGVVGVTLFHSPLFILIYFALFGVTTLFALVTLPVEFDASRRAMVWLESSGMASSMEHSKAKNALFWAAMTYVVGALGSVAQLLYIASMFLGGRQSEE